MKIAQSRCEGLMRTVSSDHRTAKCINGSGYGGRKKKTDCAQVAFREYWGSRDSRETVESKSYKKTGLRPGIPSHQCNRRVLRKNRNAWETLLFFVAGTGRTLDLISSDSSHQVLKLKFRAWDITIMMGTFRNNAAVTIKHVFVSENNLNPHWRLAIDSGQQPYCDCTQHSTAVTERSHD
jgi:hypothetical protein